MRFLYASVGVLGGLLGLACTYLFSMLAMAFGGGRGNMQAIILYVVLAFLLAAVLNFVAGCMNPRKPATRWLLAASVALWLFPAVLLGVVSYTDPASTASLLGTLKSTGVMALPSLLPLAALAVATWTGPPSSATA